MSIEKMPAFKKKIKKNWTADGFRGVWDRKDIVPVHDD